MRLPLPQIIIFLYIGFALFRLSVSAQEEYRNISNLYVNTHSRTLNIRDIITINQLFQMGINEVKCRVDSAIYYFSNALDLSNEVNYISGKARAYNNLAYCYHRKQEEEKAQEYLELAIMQDRLLKDTAAVRNAYLTLLESKLRAGHFPAIKTLYYQANPYFTGKEKPFLAQLHNILGNTYFQSGDYDSATWHYLEITRLLPQTTSKNCQILTEAYLGLGSVKYSLKIQDKAKQYYETAHQLANQCLDTFLIITTLNHIGVVYLETGKLEQAKTIAYQALALSHSFKELKDPKSMSLNIIAQSLLEADSAREALPLNMAAVDHASFLSNKIGALYRLGENYLQLNNYKEAEHCFLKALSLSHEHGMLYNIFNAYNGLSTVYENKEEYKKAFEYQKLYIKMKDSLQGKENAERIAQVEERYKTAEKDKQLARQQVVLLQKENILKQKNILIGIVSASGILCTLILFWRYKNKQRYLLQQQEITYLQERMKGEEVERGRIAQELHDGVSVLISAAKMNHTTLGKKYKDITEIKEYEEVMQLLDNTAQELRNVSQNLTPEQLIRQSLPAAIQSFCTLIEKGHGIEIEVQHFGTWSDLHTDFSYTIYRITQELIHNIVKHALATKAIVQLLAYEDILSLIVEDNGKGIDSNYQGQGMGLKNMYKRVTESGGVINIKRKKTSGTIIEIEFPINSHRNTII